MHTPSTRPLGRTRPSDPGVPTGPASALLCAEGVFCARKRGQRFGSPAVWRGREAVGFAVSNAGPRNAPTVGCSERPELCGVNSGRRPGRAHATAISGVSASPPARWLRPSFCPWSSGLGCGLGTGICHQAPGPACTTGISGSAEADEQSAGRPDGDAACHEPLPPEAPLNPCPPRPPAVVTERLPNPALLSEVFLRTKDSFEIGTRSGGRVVGFWRQLVPSHPVLLSWPRGLAVTCPHQGTGG